VVLGRVVPDPVVLGRVVPEPVVLGRGVPEPLTLGRMRTHPGFRNASPDSATHGSVDAFLGRYHHRNTPASATTSPHEHPAGPPTTRSEPTSKPFSTTPTPSSPTAARKPPIAPHVPDITWIDPPDQHLSHIS
jgi:hypothetical protein